MQIRMHAHLPNGMRRGFRLDVRPAQSLATRSRPHLPARGTLQTQIPKT
jgi:hypothetical protein